MSTENISSLTIDVRSKIKEIEEDFKKNRNINMIERSLEDLDLILEKLKLASIIQEIDNKKEIKELKTKYKQLKIEYREKHNNSNKCELLKGANEKQSPLETNADYIQHGKEVQKASNDSLDRTLDTINLTIDIGKDTAKKLYEQNEQITKITDEVANMDSTLTRTNKYINRIGRRLITDKCVWIFVILIILVISLLLYFHLK